MTREKQKEIQKIGAAFFRAVEENKNPFEVTRKMSSSRKVLKAGQELGQQYLKAALLAAGVTEEEQEKMLDALGI